MWELTPSLCFYRPFFPEIVYHQEQISRRGSKFFKQTFGGCGTSRSWCGLGWDNTYAS